MKDQVLKLCKRSDKITLDKIIMITEYDESEIRILLNALIAEGKLQKKGEYYSVIKKSTPIQKYSIFNFYTPTMIDIVLKSFCTMIPSYKVSQILGIGEKQAEKLYNIFRQTIYDAKLEQLNNYYKLKPRNSRNRIFFETEVYFYTYNNEFFVLENQLPQVDAEDFTPAEIKEFKILYSYLTRRAYHNHIKRNMSVKLTEFIWRRNKTFEDLYSELKFRLNL